MKELIKRNYQSIVRRGFITPDTTYDEFYEKLNEEVQEFAESAGTSNHWYECADIILVCLNYLEHNGIDIEMVLENKVRINEIRED